MKLTNLTFKNYQQQTIGLVLMLLFSFCSFGQNPNTPIETEEINMSLQLPPKTQQVKNLFEATYDVSLTNQELSKYLEANADNLAKWKEVLKQSQKTSKEDLAYLQQLVGNLSIKLEYLKHPEVALTTKNDNVVANTEKVNPKNSTKSVAKVANQPIQLNETSKNAKTLFEKTHKVSLTVDQFSHKMNTTPANLAEWNKVLASYQSDSTVDLSFIKTIVNAINQKLPLMD